MLKTKTKNAFRDMIFYIGMCRRHSDWFQGQMVFDVGKHVCIVAHFMTSIHKSYFSVTVNDGCKTTLKYHH